MKYSVRTFTPADQQKMTRRLRKSWNAMFGVFAFVGLFVIILLSMDRYKNGHDIIYIVFGAVYLILGGLATPAFLRMYKDKREQQKICGEFLTDKQAVQLRRSQVFSLKIPTSEKVHEVHLSEALYYLLVPGIPVYVEISKHSSTLLKMTQQGKDIPV